MIFALAYTITQGLEINAKGRAGSGDLVKTAWFFCGGLLDLFLSVILWTILDDQKSPALLVDSNRVYAVLDVTKPE